MKGHSSSSVAGDDL